MRKFVILLFILLVYTTSGYAAEVSKYEMLAGWQFFPYESIFKPLKADPATPRMGTGYSYYTSRVYVMRHALDFALGGAVPLARKDFGATKVEIGAQGLGLLAFDLDYDTDEIYSDFYLGMPVYVQFTEKFMIMCRCYHRSSHLGDETVQRLIKSERITIDPKTGDIIVIPPGQPNPNGPDDKNETSRVVFDIKRINLSYMTFDTVLFYQINETFRIYIGTGWLSDPDPYRYGTSVYQTGAEAEYLLSASTGAMLFCAFDFRGTAGFAPGISVKTGFRAFDKTALSLNFYDGPGQAQFFDQRVTSYGISFDIY